MDAFAITFDRLVAGREGEALGAPLDGTLRAGEALVVTGPNGAGKSTLLRTLAGLLPPLGGTVGIAGAAAPDGEPAARLAEISHYLGHRNALKGGETLHANLRFWQLYLGAGSDDARLAHALESVDLADLGGLAFSHLSAGQQRRAALARLLVADRLVWILDEPTAALDAASRERFARLASAHLAGGGVVIAATHLPLGFAAREVALASPARAAAGDGFA